MNELEYIEETKEFIVDGKVIKESDMTDAKKKKKKAKKVNLLKNDNVIELNESSLLL